MKVAILAGGLGTRLQEETGVKPKPMVEIGGQPVLWHIMNSYARHGHNEFVVALGYKGETIKSYFLDYYNMRNSLSIDLGRGTVEHLSSGQPNMKARMLQTQNRRQQG